MESNMQPQAKQRADKTKPLKLNQKKGKRVAAKPKKVSKWKITKKERILWILPALAIVVLAFLAVEISHYFSDYTLEQDAYQYYGGGEFRYPEGTVFHHRDGATSVTLGETTAKMASLPLYMEDESVFLPADMLYWNVGDTLQTRLEYYTLLSLDKYEQAVFSRGEKELTKTGGFLFDGKDLYVFLEPVTLKFNSYEIKLPAFSNVEVSTTSDLMLYDAQWGEFFTETPRTEVIVTSDTESYSISLINDTAQQTNGVLQLLTSEPSKLDCLMK